MVLHEKVKENNILISTNTLNFTHNVHTLVIIIYLNNNKSWD